LSFEHKLRALALCAGLVVLAPTHAYNGYAEDNPLVEAMLRMMEIFGIIDRGSLGYGVPFSPAYGYGQGGLPGLGGYGMPGATPFAPWSGAGAVPGLGAFPGGGFPGYPGGGVPGPGGQRSPYGYGQGPVRGPLDGAWELSNGAVVIIRGNAARLHVSRQRYQDYRIGYDRESLWWAPAGGGPPTRYRYRVHSGRMVLGNSDGEVLLMRRRRR
jgi:hypothetical protein